MPTPTMNVRPAFRKFSSSKKLSNPIETHLTSPTSPPIPPPVPSPPFQTYISLLHQSASKKSAAETSQIHLHMIKTNFPHLALGNKLIDSYLKSGAIDSARDVFDEMPQPHIVSWNNMMSSYIRHKRSKEAVNLFKNMLSKGVSPDEFTFSTIFKAFSDMGRIVEGQFAHGLLVVLGVSAENVFVGSSLVDMYSKFGSLGDARKVYDRMSYRDVVCSTALTVGYAQNGRDSDAIRVFGEMISEGIKANEFTFATILISCGNLGELTIGKSIHGMILKSGLGCRIASQTSLLSMYSKCGLVDESLDVFEGIPDPNTVTWTAMIGCLVCNHKEELALSTFRRMIRESVIPNSFTLSTALRGCSSLALFEQARLIHAFATKNGLESNRYVGAALVDTYGKCGRVKMARLIFDSLRELDLVSVNSMIYVYAQNGHGMEAIGLFDRMLNSGLEPNDATYTSIISACSAAGLVEEGHRIFSNMIGSKRVRPSNDHYACMVDLLGRAGRLEEAEKLISQIENPDKVLWRTLLGACKIHGKLNIAKRAAGRVLELDPGDDGTLILLTNVYASLGQWNEVSRMKYAMRDMRVKKQPAMSWVEVDREIHTFMAGDCSHDPMAAEILNELEELATKTKELGYVPDTRHVLQEMPELEKQRSLLYHSEKLAVAFGVLSSHGKRSDCVIRIFKNLRVCGDCHSWIKMVAKVVGREIVARDAKRFHHFRDGLCSCGDYW